MAKSLRYIEIVNTESPFRSLYSEPSMRNAIGRKCSTLGASDRSPTGVYVSEMKKDRKRERERERKIRVVSKEEQRH